MKKLSLIVGALLVPLMLLSGCSAGGLSESAGSEGISAPIELNGADSRGGIALDRGVSPEVIDSPTEAVITTGSITLKVKTTSGVGEKLSSLLGEYQGRIQGRQENPSTEYTDGYSNFTVRLPSDAVDSFVEKLKNLGEVESISINEQDVTLQYTDLKSRIKALEAGILRLQELIGSVDSTESLIALESAITERQLQLDSLKTQELYLADQISESTLTVSFTTTSEATKTTPETYVGGVAQGWEGLIGFLSGVLVFLGLLTPWLIPLGILVFIALLVIKRKRKRAQLENNLNGNSAELHD